jgi:hypothetical protein
VFGNSQFRIRKHIETTAYDEIGLQSARGAEDMGTDIALELLEVRTIIEVLTKSNIAGDIDQDVECNNEKHDAYANGAHLYKMNRGPPVMIVSASNSNFRYGNSSFGIGTACRQSRSSSPRALPMILLQAIKCVQPWLAESVIEESYLSPELKQTLDYLRQWSVDPKAVKNSIIHSAACPEFPHSEWANIVAGKAVSLDQVLSATYTTIADNRDVTKLGNIEITAENAGTPSKSVKVRGDSRRAGVDLIPEQSHPNQYTGVKIRQVGLYTRQTR